MSNLRRNNPCPCSSGLRFKHCHGALKQQKQFSTSSEVLRRVEQYEANELIRQQQQGLGEAIVSAISDEHQFVAVGNEVYYSSKWRTFPDFLGDYIKRVLGFEWGNLEISKPLSQRHPIMQWYEHYCIFQKQDTKEVNGIKSAAMTGVVYCYLGLAYSLYLLQHNIELQERLVKRLKDPHNFQGAYYELIVANCLIRGGFDLVLEDEADPSSKHCEFKAISKETGKTYWVEAKAKAMVGLLGKTTNGSNNPDPTSELIRHLNRALEKPAANERLIFIDLNSEPDKQASPPWLGRALKKLERREQTLTKEEIAYVFVTNMCFHRALTGKPRSQMLAHGLGIKDFGKPGPYRLSERYLLEQKHIDAHNIFKALQTYPQIPATFDGSLPSVAFSKDSERLIIGETYHFEDADQQNGMIGTVKTATVIEVEKAICCTIETKEGKSQILKKLMSDDEFLDYKTHPEGFFGSLKHSSPKKVNDPYELFKFFVESYQECTKAQLLELMKDVQNIEVLNKMEQPDLLLVYAEWMVAKHIRQSKSP